MSEQSRSEQNKVVQLNPERTVGVPSGQIVLTRLPAAMHSLRDKARQQLQGLLRDLFDKVDDAMFELADKANNNHDQNIFFDSMREVRLRRRTMEAAFFRSIDIRFAQLLDHGAYRDEAAVESREISLDDLSLVKNDDLEEIVAVDGMINKANELFAESIQHLTLRIDHLVPIKVYQKNNPLGVDVICNAFNDAAKTLQIDVKAKLVLLKLFDNMVMTKLGTVFQVLNQLLIDSNILPSLKQAPRARRVSDTAPREHYGAGLSAELAGNSSGDGYGAEADNQHTSRANPVYDEQTNQVLHSLRSLLGSREPVNRSSGEEVATQDLVKILSLAQHQNHYTSATMTPEAGTESHLNIRDLLQHLLQGQENKAQAINQVDDDVINLVSMMFDFILDDRNLATPMKALIGRLQIPMVKVAIADKTFFSKGGHPARRLLNELAMAALGWQETSEENQRKDSLYNKMEIVVQTILSDFETDIGIFTQLLTDFRAFLEKDKRRSLILEQRTLDAEDGKAKSERARAQVDAVLTRLTTGYDVPASAQKLLRDAWANVLFISVLKHGAESNEWQAGIRTAQQLVWSLTAPMTKENRQGLLKLVPELLQKLRAGLESISFSPFETTQLFKELESLHVTRLRSAPKVVAQTVPVLAPEAKASRVVKASPIVDTQAEDQPQRVAAPTLLEPKPAVVDDAEVAGVTSVPTLSAESIEEVAKQAEPALTEETAVLPLDPLAMVEASLAPIETFVVVADAPFDEASAETLPDDDHHVRMVHNLTQGSWFEMHGDNSQKFRCRLAAIIRTTGKYIFVNRSGMKVAEETRMSLALALKSGRLELLDDGMLFDRALEAVIGNLRKR